MKRYWIISAAIVVFWGAMTALLLRREAFVDVAGGGTSKPVVPQETWMAIYPTPNAGPDERIGIVHTKTAPSERDGITGAEFTLAVTLATTMMSTPAQIDITGTTWNPSSGGIASFDFDIKSFDHEMNISGRNAGGRVDLEVTTAGETIPLSLPVGKDLLVSGNLRDRKSVV